MNKIPEILAPAGDLTIAIQAYMAGADAVYLGLTDFSARKGAVNFSIEDLRKLKQFASVHKKKIYVAINTILNDDELIALTETLAYLELLEVDSVIIQDLGVLNLIKKNFPRLVVHASTQLAINSVEGLKMAEELGVERVILPREITSAQMEQFREKVPEVELEAFVHGALCYSYSGLCLASGVLLGRSGNRGECGQICRNYFSYSGKNKYSFSCNDLFLAEDAKQLQNIGISSFKIEGRLKSVEYVRAAVKLYRYVVDNDKFDSAVLDLLKQQLYLSYSRTPTKAYLIDSKGDNLINYRYPKNVGKDIGTVSKVLGRKIEISDSVQELKKGDELLVLKTVFNLKSLKIVVTGIYNGAVEVYSTKGVTVGDKVYLFKRKDMSYSSKDPGRLALFKKEVTVGLFIYENELTLHYSLFGVEYEDRFPVELQDQKGVGDIRKSFSEIFKKSDRSWFVGLVEFRTDIGSKYLPPSKIKAIRKSWLENVEKLLQLEIKNRPDYKVHNYTHEISGTSKSFFSKRANLSPVGGDRVPFAHLCDFKEITNFVSYENEIYIPLHPFISDRDYLDTLEGVIRTCDKSSFILGLNSLSHLYWYKKQNFKNVSCFIDYYLYMGNSFALELASRPLPTSELRFVYSFVERSGSYSELMIEIRDKKKLPLMVSRGCIKKNVLDSENRCNNCNGSFQQQMKNGRDEFIVVGKECINYLFLESS